MGARYYKDRAKIQGNNRPQDGLYLKICPLLWEVMMPYTYPTPRDIGLKIPPYLRETRFNAGFEHALKGGHLTEVEYFRRSFRLGFRVAKLYLREVRRHRGILDFPMRARFRLRALWRGV